jgi:hypothetical protein
VGAWRLICNSAIPVCHLSYVICYLGVRRPKYPFRGHVVCISLFLFLSLGIAFGKDSEPPREPLQQEKAFSLLLANAEKIAETEFGKYQANPRKIKALSEFISELQSIAQGKDIPQFYRLQLTADAWELGIVAKAVFGRAPVEVTRWTDQLDEVGWDLSSKANFAKKNSANPFGSVTITMVTKAGEREVSGYEVWYSPKGLDKYKELHVSSGKLSSPTSISIPPGNYVFWTVKAGKPGPPKQVNDVGVDGLVTRSIELDTL